MRHGAWRSERAAKGYIEDSLQYKKKTGNMIMDAINGFGSSAATNAIVANQSLGNNTNLGSLFDADIDEMELVEAVDRASQVLQPQSESVSASDNLFDSEIDDHTLITVTDQASQEFIGERSEGVRTNGGDKNGCSSGRFEMSARGNIRNEVKTSVSSKNYKVMTPGDMMTLSEILSKCLISKTTTIANSIFMLLNELHMYMYMYTSQFCLFFASNRIFE